MSFLEKARELCFSLASCFQLGQYPGGYVLATFFAIPLIMVSRVINLIAPWSMFINFIVFFVASLIIIQLALKAPSAEYEVYGEQTPKRPPIVLDKVVGMVIALWGIDFNLNNIKVVLLGLGLFNLLTFIKPFIVKQVEYTSVIKMIASLKGAFDYVSSDVIFGLIVNITLRLFSIF